MLKKLIRYGNSTALVLDRAILELLNMKEGGVVKLKTDGTSLIITPEAIEPTSSVSVANTAEIAANFLQDAIAGTHKDRSSLSMAINAKLKKDLTDPSKKEAFEKCAPGTENFDRLCAAFKKIMDKYKDEISKFSSPEWLQALNILSEKYKGNLTCDEYLQEACALRLQCAPLLANMDAEMLQAQQDIQSAN
jgi:antitoxin component of MazEF toxin-antitoxin module